MMSFVRWALAGGLMCVLACPDASGPAPGPGLRIVAGNNQVDTAAAQLAQPLVVELRDTTGALAAGVTVEFRALPVSGLQCPLGGCSVILSDSTVLAGILIDKPTDARGRAAVRVRLGVRVPLGRILITAQGGGGAGNDSVTIQPAAPARVGGSSQGP